jgi:hypothetical protein
MMDMTQVVTTTVVANGTGRRGLSDEDRRRIREEDRAEARRQLGSLLRLSRDRRIRAGR